jgi:hypothetical protein
MIASHHLLHFLYTFEGSYATFLQGDIILSGEINSIFMTNQFNHHGPTFSLSFRSSFNFCCLFMLVLVGFVSSLPQLAWD